MKPSTLKLASAFAFGSVVSICSVLIAVRSLAAGVPEADGMTYTGYLEDGDGAALTGDHSVSVRFYAAADAKDELCSGNNADAPSLVSGRFQIALPPKCTDAIKASPDAWAEVEVDGGPLGRTKLGVVPYALEAAHAASADAAASAIGDLDKRLKGIEALQHTPSAFRAHLSTATQIPSKKRTMVVFDQVEFDLGNEYSGGTFTAAAAGIYAVECQVEFVVGATGGWGAIVQKNGGDVAWGDAGGDASYGFSPSGHGLLKLAKGDKLTCVAYQGTNTPQPLYMASGPYGNNFSAARIY